MCAIMWRHLVKTTEVTADLAESVHTARWMA